MYKVFLNDRSIIIDTSASKPCAGSRYFDKEVTRQEIRQAFGEFIPGDNKNEKWCSPAPELLFLVFSSAFHQLPAAGGVVLNKDKVLFIFRNGVWDLPKGKIDKGETTARAALREVGEECGITGHSIIRQLPSTFHMYRSPYIYEADNWVMKETFWFEMKYEGPRQGKPQTSEGITEIKWFPVTGLTQVLANTYENLKQIIEIYRA